MTSAPAMGVVGLLTAQAVAFGVTLALLIIPANAIFLDAYGSEWLPATYVAIAVFGSAISALVAAAARRTRLVRVAVASLGGLAVLYAASWAILVTGGVWVSAALLVLFPIGLQLGFVLIGGQAGRLLDVRQMKERFPRVVSGFAVGFLVGGLLGIPLLAVLGSTEHLLLASAAAQVVFLGLLVLTERRYPEVRATPTGDATVVARPSMRSLFSSRLVVLLLAYQILSAMGSQVVDFLLFDRAAAQYSGADLTRFLSAYTAILNLVDILFLALLAGPLMRRFGLRLGLLFNPAIVAAILAVMAVIAPAPGAAFGLFVLAGVLRIADIAATDGTTRTSINASFQLVPLGDRLAVQAVVEGIGVPVAMGATGVLLLALNLFGLGIGAVISFGLALGVIWTLIALGVYRSYTGTLADQMRRSSLVPGNFRGETEAPAVRALLDSADARDVRLGLELLSSLGSEAPVAELRQLADHADPEVRMQALASLAADGDAWAAGQLAPRAAALVVSAAPPDRRAAAMALIERDIVGVDPGVLIGLLDDPDVTVRAAALDAIAPEDAASAEVVRRVVAAVGEPRTAGPAAAALRRLGASVLPHLATALATGAPPRRPSLVRAAVAVAVDHGVDLIRPLLDEADRATVLATLDALEAAGGRDVVPPAVLDRVLRDAAEHAARATTAGATLEDDHGPLVRALRDEVELARRLVIAALALRHGERVRAAARAIDHGDSQRRALGVEALDVLLTREEAATALPLVRGDLPASPRADDAARRPEDWVRDIATDPQHHWRSAWLAACARHPTGERR